MRITFTIFDMDNSGDPVSREMTPEDIQAYLDAHPGMKASLIDEMDTWEHKFGGLELARSGQFALCIHIDNI